MSRHSFSLSSIGMTRGRALVKLDGEDISDAVQGIGLDFSAKGHPRVMLDLASVSADVAVDDVEIQLPQKTVALLQRLGWTPPGYPKITNLGTVTGGHDGPRVPTSDEPASEGPSTGVGESIT